MLAEIKIALDVENKDELERIQTKLKTVLKDYRIVDIHGCTENDSVQERYVKRVINAINMEVAAKKSNAN